MRNKIILFLLGIILSLLTTKAMAYSANDYYGAGLQLYNAKNYPLATQYFTAAINIDPINTSALMGRANSYYAQGRYSEALSDYQKVETLLPSEPVAKMIQYLQGKVGLSPLPGDNAISTSALSEKKAVKEEAPKRKKGARLFAAFSSLNLSDFTASALAQQGEAKYFQANYDPTFQYNGVVPSASPNLGIEADYPLGNQFEVGIAGIFLPVGTASDDIFNSSGFTLTDSYNITESAIGVVGRYFLMSGQFQPWIAGGPVVVPGSIDYQYNLDSYGAAVSFTGPFTGLGFGGQVQAGVDVRLADVVSISLFGGYLFGSSNNFQGTIGTTNIPGVASGSQVQLMTVPTTQGNVIVPVSNGVLCVPTYNNSAGSPIPPGSKPLVVDISGPEGGLSLDIYW